MPKINKKNMRIESDLNVFLVSKQGIFSNIKGKKIKFNPKPNSEKTESNVFEETVENQIERGWDSVSVA